MTIVNDEIVELLLAEKILKDQMRDQAKENRAKLSSICKRMNELLNEKGQALLPLDVKG